MDSGFLETEYLIRRKLFTFRMNALTIEGKDGQPLFHTAQKAFRLKADIRLFIDPDLMDEVLTIKARSVFDFGATFDVIDSETGEAVGALRRNGWRSLFRDEWLILTPDDEEMGIIREDSLGLSLFRRVLGFLPQTFNATIGDNLVAVFEQQFTFFNRIIRVDFRNDSEGLLDPRLALASAVLLCIVERRHQR